ncbi:aldehyde dehydrogenase family protein [Nisaea acidiphila]|uniref:Aldehyde dehydrogenase family protein n=1 Tax=Nisaea acidiphila TaxID=1862145 RepID=A0A9J7ANI1_9PROT|nr:aldehyde dehydrogenase family protein [Nisaea acidiphila]UUX48498.1 aldehyde dehydrogenase family protein [Nisaea acidiphila]
MLDRRAFFIDGSWVAPADGQDFEVVNPATEEGVAIISLGGPGDVDRAVRAARDAFEMWSESSVEDRVALLTRARDIYLRRRDEVAEAMTMEMGAPRDLSRESQAPCGDALLEAAIEALENHVFERPSLRGGSTLRDEAAGVAGLITPWNWPVNQVMTKVASALAAGCTMVLKPSEYAPLSAGLVAEVLAEAGCPPGVFNLVHGDGFCTGAALSSHPEIDLLSFTGSTRAGTEVMKAAANGIRRVALELGGKSPNILFADTDLDTALRYSVENCFSNSGQSCDAPTRLLVEKSVYDEAVTMAGRFAAEVKVGDPLEPGEHIGPLVNKIQFERVQEHIRKGIEEGARVVTGGLGKPEGFERGYFVKPTLFADVTNDMHIARNEIFGPVLVMIPFDGEDEAVAIGNDTDYGLAAYIQTSDDAKAQRVARRLRAGNVYINGNYGDTDVPFGGYKQSGLGRENGPFGLEDFLETKAITG